MGTNLPTPDTYNLGTFTLKHYKLLPVSPFSTHVFISVKCLPRKLYLSSILTLGVQSLALQGTEISDFNLRKFLLDHQGSIQKQHRQKGLLTKDPSLVQKDFSFDTAPGSVIPDKGPLPTTLHR